MSLQRVDTFKLKVEVTLSVAIYLGIPFIGEMLTRLLLEPKWELSGTLKSLYQRLVP
jgi:ACR3 family arsenite efflux pump ArsB